MTDTARLRQKISELGMKYNYIAKKLGLSPNGLLKKVENRSEFKASEIQKLCVILGINSREEVDLIFFAEQVE